MKKTILAVSAAAILVAGLMFAVGTVAAQPRDDRPGAGRDGAWECPYYPGVAAGDTLNLTADQKKKLIDLQEKFFTDNDKITDSIIAKKREMRKLYLAEKPDFKAIDKVQDEMRTLADKRIALSRDFRNKARALLTDEQLKANPFAFTMGPGFGGGFGPGMMGPGGGCGRGWDDDGARGGGHKWWKHHRR